MASTQVVETSVANSCRSQNSSHPDHHFQSRNIVHFYQLTAVQRSCITDHSVSMLFLTEYSILKPTIPSQYFSFILHSLGSLLQWNRNFISKSSNSASLQRFMLRRLSTACWLCLQSSKSGYFLRFPSSRIYSWFERHVYDRGSHICIANCLQYRLRDRWWILFYLCELPRSHCESDENCCCAGLGNDDNIDICGQRSPIGR